MASDVNKIVGVEYDPDYILRKYLYTEETECLEPPSKSKKVYPPKENCAQTEEKKMVDASEITKEQIETYFDGLEFCCPSNTNIGSELKGETADNVLQELLDDMNDKKFPFPAKTAEDLARDAAKSMPKGLHDHIQRKCVLPFMFVLEKVQFKEKTCEDLLESYRTLTRMLIEHRASYTVKNDEYPSEFFVYLRLFLLKLLENHAHERAIFDEDIHDCLVDFWNSLLLQFSDDDQEEKILFQVSKRNARGNMKVTLKLKPACKQPTIEVTSNPDVLCEALAYDDDHDDPMFPSYMYMTRRKSYVFRSIAVEIKATRLHRPPKTQDVTSPDPFTSMPDESTDRQYVNGTVRQKHPPNSTDINGSHHIAPKTTRKCSREPAHISAPQNCHCLSQLPTKLENTKDLAPMLPCLEPLRTEHLLHLVSLVESPGLVDQAHGIGLYIVMHRVYLTGLHVVSKRPLPYSKRLVFTNRPLDRTDACHYRMVCCKYFNIFKPAHFQALMQLLEYLIFHQHVDFKRFV